MMDTLTVIPNMINPIPLPSKYCSKIKNIFKDLKNTYYYVIKQKLKPDILRKCCRLAHEKSSAWEKIFGQMKKLAF